MLPSASYIKWAVFRYFVPFLRETFLMQVREKFKKLSQVLLCFLVCFFCFRIVSLQMCNKTKMPAILKVKFKMAA